MGQQQLLLVILVTIIVGIATVVAINTFSSAADSANVDAVRQDVASIAAAAQGFYMKPVMLGGGGRSFTGITFEKFAFAGTVHATTKTEAANDNGRYEITANGQELTVVAHPSSCADYATNNNTCATADQLTATIEPDKMSWS